MVITDRKRAARAKVLNAKLGQRIASLCEQHELSQRQLAIRAGLDPSYVSRIIRGLTEPGLVTADVIAEVFGKSLSEFLTGVER
jgi:transcriptional regulator with XRE-family HTH domain